MGGNELEAVVGVGDLGERHPDRAIQFTADMRLGSLKATMWDRRPWIIRLREKIPLFSTLRWEKQS